MATSVKCCALALVLEAAWSVGLGGWGLGRAEGSGASRREARREPVWWRSLAAARWTTAAGPRWWRGVAWQSVSCESVFVRCKVSLSVVFNTIHRDKMNTEFDPVIGALDLGQKLCQVNI